MNTFDPDSFLNQTINSELATRMAVCPEGEYPACITKVDMRSFTYKKEDRAGQTGYSLDVTWEITDENLKASLGRAPLVRQSMLLDLSESGGLLTGEGKNVSLGRLREAIGQNKPGAAWSPRHMEGASAIVLVSHKLIGDDVMAEVKKVAPL